MEGRYKGGLKGYWKRRAYQRLEGSGGRRRGRAELGGGRRRFWRIRISPKLRFFRAVSPKRFLTRIRDAYVRMMLGFASSAAISGGGYGFGYGYGVGGEAVDGFGRGPLKEYDEKMIVRIYTSLLAQGTRLANGGPLTAPPAAQVALRPR